jgi:hypothetical protein
MTETPTEGVGTPTPRLNGYLCFYRGQDTEVRAATSHEAQLKAAEWMRKKFPRRKIKDSDVDVHLVEKFGEPVIHTATN